MTESRFDPEDEAFNEIERQAQQRKEAVKAALLNTDPRSFMSWQEGYENGWNSAIDKVVQEIEKMQGFGQTTIDSFVIYIRGMKR